MAENESWAPKTREDWVELFADGQMRAGAKRDEEEAKRKAAEGNSGDKPPEGEGDKKPRTFAERILGA